MRDIIQDFSAAVGFHSPSAMGHGVRPDRRMLMKRVPRPAKESENPTGVRSAPNGAGYSGVSMSRWPRSGQGCSKASVNARPGGREDLDERVPVASQAPELGRVAEVEPGPEGVAVVPPDPLDLRLQLLPGGHRTSILTAWEVVR